MFDHDYPGDNREDHEFHATFDEDIEVRVSKVGGGTVGRDYVGDWHYTVIRDGELVAFGSDLHTGSPTTHQEAARLVLDFLTDDDGNLKLPTVTIRCTFSDVWWPSDEPDSDYAEAHGWANPRSSNDAVEMPGDVCGSLVEPWMAENVPNDWTLLLDVDEAVEFLRDFEGGIWDFCEADSFNVEETYDGKTIWVDRTYTAHVKGPGTQVVFKRLD